MHTIEELAEWQEKTNQYCEQLLEMADTATELFTNSDVDSIIHCLVIAIRKGPEYVDELASACTIWGMKTILKEVATP